MALRRLKKEWAQWQEASEALDRLGGLEAEQKAWKLELFEAWRLGLRPWMSQEDYFKWVAELQVSSGPLSGATFIYRLNFPADYPFKPPQVVPAFAGVAVAFGEIHEGWHIYTPRSQQRGEVLAASEEGLLVQWADGTGERLEESDVSHVVGQSPSFALYHPLLSDTGHFCLCGIRDKWAPHMTITVLLSFARAAVEDAAGEGIRPIPPGSCNDMCFCTVNGSASEDLRQGPWRWYCRARRRFFGDKGVVPLCVSVRGSQRLVQCSSMAGTLLGEVEIDSERSMEELEHLVIEKVPMAEGGTLWKLVLPDGACLSDSQRSQSIRDLLVT